MILLTKPLGTQLAVNAFQWKNENKIQNLELIKDILTLEDIDVAFDLACASMSRLNKFGARMMKKYKSHGATDVTGFGIMGHLANLATAQKEQNLKMVLHTLPVIKNMAKLDKVKSFKLHTGYSAETSGGIMMLVER